MIEPLYKRYIGFDCGYKKLGVAIVDIDFNLLELFREIFITLTEHKNGQGGFYDKDNITVYNMETGEMNTEWKKLVDYLFRLENRLLLCFRPQYLDVIDVLGGRMMKEVSEMDKIRALKAVIYSDRLNPEKMQDVHVIIEQQPRILHIPGAKQNPSNIDNVVISHEIASYYDDYCDVDFISPVYKNKFRLVEDTFALAHAKKDPTKKTSYTVNKMISTHNFKYLAGVMGWDYSHVPNDSVDDVADAFMQILGFLVKEKKITMKKYTWR
jgi:hypothetical protein